MYKEMLYPKSDRDTLGEPFALNCDRTIIVRIVKSASDHFLDNAPIPK